jgi:7-cyano-7-deazaguanine reductase
MWSCGELAARYNAERQSFHQLDKVTPMAKQLARRASDRYGLDEIAASHLESWPNEFANRDYVVHFEIPEFTCLCPRSGFPDFATIVIDYVPDRAIVELKSLKLYINGFRDRSISHEGAANTICDDLVALLAPRWLRVVGEFNVRGNIKTVVTVEYAAEGYAGPRPAYRRPTFAGI